MLVLASVILPPFATNVVLPAAFVFEIMPFCVKFPVVVTAKLPLMVEAFKAKSLASVKLTLFPLTIPKLEKSFPLLVKVIFFVEPAVIVVAPLTLTAPV